MFFLQKIVWHQPHLLMCFCFFVKGSQCPVINVSVSYLAMVSFFNKLPSCNFSTALNFKLSNTSRDYSLDIPAAAAKSLQLHLTLCDPIDGSPPGSAVPGILQARTLEWVAISFSNAWEWKVKGKSLSRVRLFETPWTTAYQAPPSMGFPRQEYWSGVPSPSPRHS